MRNILKGLLEAEAYRFPSAEELGFEEESPPGEPAGEASGEAVSESAPPPPEEPAAPEDTPPPMAAEAPFAPAAEQPVQSPPPGTGGPVQYAQLQAELILKQAREEAEALLAEARAAAKNEQEEIRMGARDEGYREGYAQGTARAMEDAQRDREAMAEQMEKEVQAFLEKADMARMEALDQAKDELLDLCIAVAEKVVRVSLKSSSEVIVRMIQTATERLKRQEWVHIYISGCDTKSAAQISPALTAALGALSHHVKIIPMGDDEGGTCIVETPEEIIDASVSTQMANIRDLLRDQMGAF